MIEDLGGADVCYGGIGWCGHIAFWEADLGYEFVDDLEAYKKAGPGIVELTPMPLMQNACTHSAGIGLGCRLKRLPSAQHKLSAQNTAAFGWTATLGAE